MKKDQKLWTREELILAISLYCKLPFGKLHKNNHEIIKLSKLLDRTPSSIAYKLVNFASLDPSLQARGITGAVNTSKLDKKIWNEFYQNWDKLPYESEKLRAILEKTSLAINYDINEKNLSKEGRERESLVKARINQIFFRKTVLASYNYRCCITGLQIPELLVAGHISPWSLDERNRLNPRNGLAMNALHDQAFETGLITITPDYKIRISSILQRNTDRTVEDLFLKYHEKSMILPTRFLPDIQFLKYHNNERFKN